MNAHPLVKIVQDPAKGRILVAAKDLLAGQAIVRERPLIVAVNHFADMQRAFHAASPEVQQAVLGFHAPVDGQKAAELRRLLKGPKDVVEQAIKVAMVFNLNAAEIEKLVDLRFSPAAIEAVRPAGCDLPIPKVLCKSGLYEVAGKISHSCAPNCNWGTDDEATGTRVVWPLCDLSEGEELSISYMESSFLLNPAPERRAELKARREFICQCPRCSARGDDTRRFPCCGCTDSASIAARGASKAKPRGDQHQGHCSGYHMAVIQQVPQRGDPKPQQQAASDGSEARHDDMSGTGSGTGSGVIGDQRLTECSECGRRAPTAWVDKVLREEAETTKEVARLKAIEASRKLPPEWWDRVRRLRPPHPHHRLAHNIGLLLWVPEYAASNLPATSKALESIIACLEAIIGPQRSCTLTVLHRHFLGIVKLGLPIRIIDIPLFVVNPPDQSKAGPGLASLRRAVQDCMVAFGPGGRANCSEPEKDLLDAQMLLAPGEAAALASLEACSFCGNTRAAACQFSNGSGGCSGGVTAAVITAMPRCGRCGRAAYCCRDHQAMQWPLHKKSCRPPAAAAAPAAADVAAVAPAAAAAVPRQEK